MTDQKPKWREWWVSWLDENLHMADRIFKYSPIGHEEDYAVKDLTITHVIEAAPALAEIEKLRAENVELKNALKLAREYDDKDLAETETKLTAATAQLEKIRNHNEACRVAVDLYTKGENETMQKS